MTTFRTRRVYDDPSAEDGVRVLADRLWPRGLSKDKAEVDLWLKDVTPSNELRTWYHAHPEEFAEFAGRYRTELAAQADALDELRAAGDVVTLLTARKEIEGSHLTVLLAVLQSSP
ncbi:MAG: DUF488 family protein [Actinomycetota bacterium]|nr:DUF488 family protein [Actinomycetota bacterium]